MPNYKGHLAGGFVVFFILLYIVRFLDPPIITAMMWLACALFGSLFPDIDTKSKGQLLSYRIIALLLFILLVQQRLQFALCVTTVSLLPLVVHHRGLFHRAWFILIMSGSLFAYTWMILPEYRYSAGVAVLFFCAGALSHLWLDVGFAKMWRIP